MEILANRLIKSFRYSKVYYKFKKPNISCSKFSSLSNFNKEVYRYFDHKKLSSKVLITSVGLLLSGLLVSYNQKEISHSDFPPQDLEALNNFKKILREDQIDTDIEERLARAKPWNSYHSSEISPLCILYPETTEDVGNILKVCYEFNIPVIPFGGGTSIEGHTIFLKSTSQITPISIDLNRMTSIVEFNKDDLDITVQAGLGDSFLKLKSKIKL